MGSAPDSILVGPTTPAHLPQTAHSAAPGSAVPKEC